MFHARSLLIALAVLLGISASACGSDADLSAAIAEVNKQATTSPGEPVPVAFTDAIADRAAQQESFRFSMNMSMNLSDGSEQMDISPDAPVAVGEVAGDRSRVTVDVGGMLRNTMSLGVGDAAGATAMLDAMDLTMETITTSDSFYLRAPMYAEIAKMNPASSAGVEPLVEMGDGWGRVDYGAIPAADLDRILSEAGGMSPSDPTAFRSMIDGLRGDTYKLEETEIDGVKVTHYSGTISLADASGLDSAGSLTGGGTDAMTAKMLKQKIPLDFYVDADNNLRRVAYEMDLSEFIRGLGGGSFGLAMSMDYSDYGADIEIQVPEETVDLTQWALSFS